MNKTKVSFIIPALNEEKHIKGVIDSIKKNVSGRFVYEIIVVDNGSVDRTRNIAKRRGSYVFCVPGVTISALRNTGVAKAHGEIIGFIDADVYLKANWGKNIDKAIEVLEHNPMTIIGSIYGLREKPTWVERNWYKPILNKKNINYINGGHLITTKVLFEKVGGFEETLETGEDYDFCNRARKIGTKIINDPSLEVMHEGYPKTIISFFQRERWHGRGDYFSFGTILSSKPAMFSLAQFGVMIISLALAITYADLLFLLIYASFMVGLCGGSAFYRCGRINITLLACTFLYLVYFLARGIAFFDVVKRALYSNVRGKYHYVI